MIIETEIIIINYVAKTNRNTKTSNKSRAHTQSIPGF